MQASYLRTRVGDFVVLMNGDSVSSIPVDPANADYQNIMALVAEGKLVIAPAE